MPVYLNQYASTSVLKTRQFSMHDIDIKPNLRSKIVCNHKHAREYAMLEIKEKNNLNNNLEKKKLSKFDEFCVYIYIYSAFCISVY